MSGEEGSPFWATPPYILLTDVLQLDKVEPWNVDVGKLVGAFLREMKRIGDIAPSQKSIVNSPFCNWELDEQSCFGVTLFSDGIQIILYTIIPILNRHVILFLN